MVRPYLSGWPSSRSACTLHYWGHGWGQFIAGSGLGPILTKYLVGIIKVLCTKNERVAETYYIYTAFTIIHTCTVKEHLCSLECPVTLIKMPKTPRIWHTHMVISAFMCWWIYIIVACHKWLLVAKQPYLTLPYFTLFCHMTVIYRSQWGHWIARHQAGIHHHHQMTADTNDSHDGHGRVTLGCWGCEESHLAGTVSSCISSMQSGCELHTTDHVSRSPEKPEST